MRDFWTVTWKYDGNPREVTCNSPAGRGAALNTLREMQNKGLPVTDVEYVTKPVK